MGEVGMSPTTPMTEPRGPWPLVLLSIVARGLVYYLPSVRIRKGRGPWTSPPFYVLGNTRLNTKAPRRSDRRCRRGRIGARQSEHNECDVRQRKRRRKNRRCRR